MIDWFASKMGVLVFAAVAASVLLAFAGTQMGIMHASAQAQAANTLANILDKVCEGCNTTLVFDRVYPINITGQKVTVGDTARNFYANATPASLTAGSVNVYRTGGNVYVQKA